MAAIHRTRSRFILLSAVVIALAATELPVHVTAAAAGGQYHPLSPSRILDTRDGTGGVPAAPIGPHGSLNVQVAGGHGVPSTASAAVINVTVTDTTAPSYLTVYPTGVTRPVASNLNWVAGETVPNLVEVSLGTSGQVTIFNAAGNVDVVFDVAGYVSPAPATGADGLFNPLVPARLLDTRDGTGAPRGPLGPRGVLDLQITGRGHVPSTGVSAVVLNVTVTDATASSYLTVFPAGASTPLASNLNFVAGQTVPNRVIVGVGTGGQVSIFNAQGSVDVIADVGGWFTDSSDPSAIGSTFVGVTPARILDTRDGTGLVNGFNGVGPVPKTRLGPREGIAVQVAGRGGIPAMTDPNPPNAVVANVTVTDATAPSYLTAWPDGSLRPLTSDLNWVAGLTIPNLVVVKLGSSGMADLFNAAGCTNAIVDVVGYYTGPLPPASPALAPTPSCGMPPPDPFIEVGLRVKMPELGIDLAIIEGNGVVPDYGFADHYPGTMWPGHDGRSLIYAHAQPGMFGPLLEYGAVGQAVEIDEPDGRVLHYTISRFTRNWPATDISILLPTDHEELILYTCTSWTFSDPKVVAFAEPSP
jgi:hypothetical protein